MSVSASLTKTVAWNEKKGEDVRKLHSNEETEKGTKSPFYKRIYIYIYVSIYNTYGIYCLIWKKGAFFPLQLFVSLEGITLIEFLNWNAQGKLVWPGNGLVMFWCLLSLDPIRRCERYILKVDRLARIMAIDRSQHFQVILEVSYLVETCGPGSVAYLGRSPR